MLKRDEPTASKFWQLQAIGWIGLYALFIGVALTNVQYRSLALFAATVRWAMWFFASCALRPICRSLVRRSLQWWQLELRAVGWSSLAGIAATLLLHAPALLHVRQLAWTGLVLVRDWLQASVLLFLWCNLYFSIKQSQRSAQERERLARAEADAREARLSALRYQLNPHFLFNSLNAASTLALEGDVPSAVRMLAQIADLLRTTLDKQLPFEVSLSEEMVFTKRYLAIEQTRLGERLQVDLAISADTLDAAVPSMFLQPLVENAIRHGIAPVVEGGKVAIRSTLQDSQLRIVVTNTGPPGTQPDKPAGGIGLANTAERLQTLYGAHHRFDLQWPKTGGCEVLIQIPFRRAPHQTEELACAY